MADESGDEEIHNLMCELGTTLGLLFQRSDDLLDYNIRNQENKAILGDIKSGYLNSFGAFFCQGVDSETRQSLRTIESLEQIYRIIGEKKFQERLQEFDQLNIELIQLYRHKLERLEAKLNGQATGLVANLKGLPELLYWRDQAPQTDKA